MHSKIRKIFLQEFMLQRPVKDIVRPKNFVTSFQQQSGYDEEQKIATVKLSAVLKNEGDGSLVIQASVVGIFQFDKEKEQLPLNDFLRLNAAATLFPFLRTYIADMARKADLGDVIIPMIDLKEWYDRDKAENVAKQRE